MQFQRTSVVVVNILIVLCFPSLEEVHSQIEIDAVDIFHEEGYFSTEDVRYLFDYCKKKGLSLKSHADEFPRQ